MPQERIRRLYIPVMNHNFAESNYLTWIHLLYSLFYQLLIYCYLMLYSWEKRQNCQDLLIIYLYIYTNIFGMHHRWSRQPSMTSKDIALGWNHVALNNSPHFQCSIGYLWSPLAKAYSDKSIKKQLIIMIITVIYLSNWLYCIRLWVGLRLMILKCWRVWNRMQIGCKQCVC